MAKEKKPVHKVQMTDGKRQIIQQLLQEYNIETAEDIQDALKDLLGGTIKEMMEYIIKTFICFSITAISYMALVTFVIYQRFIPSTISEGFIVNSAQDGTKPERIAFRAERILDHAQQ